MKRAIFLFSTLAISLSACGSSQPAPTATQVPTNTQNTEISETAVSESTLEYETIEAIPSFTPLPGPCSTPAPNELNDFINSSITIEDNGKTFITHLTSRFWIYLDDRIYPLRDLLNSIPEGLIGYISNGSIRGPQCYPIMFEAVREGKGLLQIKDFQLSIIVDNNMPESPLPLH
ncbi:MAG TPA: hypothetical protein VF352_09075 [Anaerolineales bacterium]